jgi:hypothetical protein
MATNTKFDRDEDPWTLGSIDTNENLLGPIDTNENLLGSIDTNENLLGSIDTNENLLGSIDTNENLLGSIDTRVDRRKVRQTRSSMVTRFDEHCRTDTKFDVPHSIRLLSKIEAPPPMHPAPMLAIA